MRVKIGLRVSSGKYLTWTDIIKVVRRRRVS
jgi:hypothetical protein